MAYYHCKYLCSIFKTDADITITVHKLNIYEGFQRFCNEKFLSDKVFHLSMLIHTMLLVFGYKTHFLCKQVYIQELSDIIFTLILDGRLCSIYLVDIIGISNLFEPTLSCLREVLKWQTHVITCTRID